MKLKKVTKLAKRTGKRQVAFTIPREDFDILRETAVANKRSVADMARICVIDFLNGNARGS